MIKKPCCQPNIQPWYQRKIVVLAIFSLLLIPSISLINKQYELLTYSLSLFQMMWWAIGLGLIIAGIIHALVPQKYIIKTLSAHKKRTLITAAFFGILLSTCCHGILAIAIELYKKGASTPAIIVLLTASPWANLPMTILLCTFFGLKGFLIIGLAVVIALITGLIFQFFQHQQWLDTKESENLKLDLTEFSILSDIAHRYRHFKYTKTNLAKTGQSILKGSINNANSVLWWFAIAWAMASFIGFYIPSPRWKKI